MKRYTKGFTLIELLVVIAIIGILASVVLVSLNSARSKGKDTRVLSDIQQLRTQMESDNVGGNYSASFTATGANGAFLTTGNYSTVETDLASNGTGGVITIAPGGTPGANGLIIVTNGVVTGGVFSPVPTAYALYGLLSNGKYFCLASDGSTNPAAVAHTAITCPATGS